MLLAACASAPVGPPAVMESTIEPSEGLGAPIELLGAGDATAERCFRHATESQGETVARCRNDEMDACAKLVQRWAARAPDCAAKVGELACHAEHAPSCAALATHLLKQPSPPATRVRRLLGRACDGGVAKACTQLGKRAYERLKIYDVGIIKRLKRGCALGDGEACFIAANARRTRALDGPQAELLERGCDLEHEPACMVLGLALAGALQPPGSDKQKRGLQLLDGVCDGSGPSAAQACFTLGQFVSTGNAGYYARACDKGHFNACVEIVTAHRDAGRAPEAVQLAGKMIAQHPGQWLPRWIRGSILFNSGEHAKAIADLDAVAGLRSDWPLLEVWLYAAQARSGGDGTPRLRKAHRALGGAAWPAPVFNYMLGRLPEARLLRQAKHKTAYTQRQQECEAFYYIGQHLMIAGNARRAKGMFQRAVATQITDYIEFTGAKAELARLAP